ncbi:hypothetical protein Cfor_10730 [Coptotermes formosanus]|jgi:hypothetical protein|uniref:Reverse transcriptase domain-containing protein n=1 Tax=Coptotermes formosanus TaxID=36987 RepID=A0A6L2PM37_COPFO|nr:hypothetical protein Cfor_10730 [Coptotermes formosanus]
MQNYFLFDNKFFQPSKDVAMGSPILGLVAETFLQFYKHPIVKGNLENNNIIFYNRYVDNILIIFDDHKITTDRILSYMNSIHKHLISKLTNEENETISFLDLPITRNQDELNINIFQKPTTTDTTIHYKSNHLMENKLAMY